MAALLPLRNYSQCVALVICTVAIAIFPADEPASDTPSALTLPRIFGEHMMFQAGQPLPVWGTAATGGTITAEFSGRKNQPSLALTDTGIELDLMPASVNPFTPDCPIAT